MKLVVDTNNIIAALIKNGISRRIIFSPAINFITPEYTLQEISKYEKLICKKAKLNKEEFQRLLNFIFEYITIIPKEEYKEVFNHSKTLIDDIDDIPFIALCLASEADGIWSDDTHFKTKNEIIVFRTKELALAFKSPNSK
jgi:predicted nucleic acid-binding protein